VRKVIRSLDTVWDAESKMTSESRLVGQVRTKESTSFDDPSSKKIQMSASGYKRTSTILTGMSALRPIADISEAKINVRL